MATGTEDHILSVMSDSDISGAFDGFTEADIRKRATKIADSKGYNDKKDGNVIASKSKIRPAM